MVAINQDITCYISDILDNAKSLAVKLTTSDLQGSIDVEVLRFLGMISHKFTLKERFRFSGIVQEYAEHDVMKEDSLREAIAFLKRHNQS